MNLAKYLSSKPRGFKSSFAREIGISPAFLRQIETGYTSCPWLLARKIERVTNGKVRKSDLRPDIWDIADK